MKAKYATSLPNLHHSAGVLAKKDEYTAKDQREGRVRNLAAVSTAAPGEVICSGMVSPATRRRLQAIAVGTSASVLLVASFCLTFTGFLVWHFATTRPHHTIPFHFELSRPSSPKHPSQLAYVSLYRDHRLRSVGELTASVRLLVPESHVNLDNSVFYLSAELFGRPKSPAELVNTTGRTTRGIEGKNGAGLCLARGSAQAAMRYRSPVHKGIRAAMLFMPLLLGLSKEYQTVQVHMLSYRAVPEGALLPVLDGLSIELHPAEIQVADARLELRVRRRPFIDTMMKEGRIPGFLVIVIGLWYAMLFWLFMTVALVSALRRAAERLLYIADTELNNDGDRRDPVRSSAVESRSSCSSSELYPRSVVTEKASVEATSSTREIPPALQTAGLRRRVRRGPEEAT